MYCLKHIYFSAFQLYECCSSSGGQTHDEFFNKFFFAGCISNVVYGLVDAILLDSGPRLSLCSVPLPLHFRQTISVRTHSLSHILVCVFSSIVCSEFAGCAFHLGFMWQFELRRKKKPSNIEISMCFKQFKSSLPWHLSLRSLVRAQTKQLKPFRTHMRRLSSMFLGFG